MNWKRRFSSACAHEFLKPPPVRIRTWSDSVAEVATAEEMADRDSELAEAHRRRSSNASIGAGSRENQHHVTGFLASQTLALFLAVPNIQSSSNTSVRYDDLSQSGTSLLENDVDDEKLVDVHCNKLSRSSSLRRSSDQNSSASSTVSSKPWRRFSERFSGATLSAAMASATKLRRNTVVAVSTGKLDQVSVEGRAAQSEDSMTIDEPLNSPLSSSTKENNQLSSTVADTPKNHQLKKFSQSTPALPQLHYDLQDLGRSKSKQKKFLRHFPNVPRDERVLNHYSCALVGDILLQGHLYVTYNYFAFHSNVFGYVRKILIPMADVRKITKEKTAKFFPNAIAITTATEKHLFSSLMSRDVAYRLALSVWKKFHFPNRMGDCIDGERENEGSSLNGEHSSNESSQNSVEGLIISQHTASSGVQITTATEETTSDPDENSSAIDHSYSPTPDRDDVKDGKVSTGSPPIAKSRRSFLDFFSSRTSFVNEDDENKDDPATSDDLGVVCDNSSSLFKIHNSPLELSWGCSGICFLLVILCLSAGVLWYRIFLLHSHLELRLSPETTGELNSPVSSLYSPQMQELVDNLHLLLTSRTTNEQRERSTVT
ncbi:GRAM domain-containing protein 2B-like isoform X1 [Daphnia carinata]|uniref:GRAM domain-containing protein 2B-like isoform X1 n=1 Tax=Daphnia carinata TaxID=120202 RepID=UPI00257DDB83|nr:GRAM domain-containing protein 2B-like isoform X1 [Daphnia carinata]